MDGCRIHNVDCRICGKMIDETLAVILTTNIFDVKFDNLQYNTVGRWVNGTMPSDGPMFILIDWE